MSTRARLCRDPRRERADLSPHALAARPDLARQMAHEVGGERCQDARLAGVAVLLAGVPLVQLT